MFKDQECSYICTVEGGGRARNSDLEPTTDKQIEAIALRATQQLFKVLSDVCHF